MCLCPLPNYMIDGAAYKSGLEYFDCGACPECLQKRANGLVLRAVYESKIHKYNCMCTLTYDSYIYDENGKIVGEKVADRSVDKNDVQKFVKRVRDYFGYPDMKYLISAEYGKHTGRPHYHCLFFGVNFSDAVYYKKSKRGNVIMQSHTLNKLWKHGICTVDSNTINAAKARYCTKYAVKDTRSMDTFMLMSHGLGIRELYRCFNGKYYILDGRYYTVPRKIWELYICDKYPHLAREISNKYINAPLRDKNDPSSRVPRSCVAVCRRSDERRAFYRSLRDSDPLYQNYLRFWQHKSEIFDHSFATIPKRILLLDDRKYHNYKHAALVAFSERLRGRAVIPPNSNCYSWLEHWRFESSKYKPKTIICPSGSCPNRANDRKMWSDDRIELFLFGSRSKSAIFKPKRIQISFDFLLKNY